MPKAKQTFQTLDLYLAAFLSLSGTPPVLESKNTRVVFSFPANVDLYRLISNFNENVSVPVAQYAMAVKALRGQMITMREGGAR